MLRDKLEVAINDLIVALRGAADAYETAAQIVEHADCAALFARGREDYRKHAERLEGEQRRLGHLPKEPDAEEALLHEVVTHLKTGLAGDELAALLDECKEQEERVASCADAVLDLEPPKELSEAAAQLKRQSADHGAELAALRAAVGTG